MDGLGNGFENNSTAIRAARKAANSIKDAITDEISKVNAEISSIQKESEERQAKEELAQFMEDFALRGSGGTDFRPVFQYVDKLIAERAFQNLKGLIYFTDGYGTFRSADRPMMPHLCSIMRIIRMSACRHGR